MSQFFLSQVLKPLAYKNVLKHNKKMVRWCSSTPIYPFLLLDHLLKVGDSHDDCLTRRSVSDGENEITIKSKLLVKQVRNAMTMGFNQSGVNIIHLKEKTFLHDIDKVRLNIYYKPCDPKSKPVAIHLPPLPKCSQIQNLAMSSLPDQENQDWVVAIKLGSKLMLYRNRDLRWIDIETTHAHECISPYSSLMYSKKDQRFYVPSPGGQFLCSFDLNFKEKDEPKYDLMWKKDLPQYMSNEMEHINSFTRTNHLVESPTGELFIISWYYGDELELYKGETTVTQKTKRFLVFKEQETSSSSKKFDMNYTENIGDLCIFLGHGEALCLQASLSPGLKPNCIYFVGHNYGVFDITTQICTLFSTEEGPLRSTEFPFWPHPFSLTPH